MLNEPRLISFAVGTGHSVSGRLLNPEGARACFVLAHGAGAGMDHPAVAVIASGLAERGVATFRYQFPFMEAGSRRPDPPALAHTTVRAAVAEAARLAPGLPLIAGGRSFGGRMTSQAHALMPLLDVRGLAFLAFPLHPAGKPAVDRAAHLRDVRTPMLFLQGTNDALAEIALLRSVVAEIGSQATLHAIEAADHAMHVPARSGRQDSAVRTEMLDRLAEWISKIADH